jgi:cell division protein FtsI (penicillin-binding protein 3)
MTAVSGMIELVRQPSRNGFSGWRVVVLAAALLFLGALMIVRLVSLQVLDPERYVEHGESQRIRTQSLSAERGAIVDRNGVELVVSSPRESIWADPRLVLDPRGTAEQIVAIAGGDVAKLTQRLSNGEAKFAWLARQLDDESSAAVLELALPGIYGTREQARLTPSGGNVARGILGRTDIDGIGLSGLEAQYDDVLTGEPGRIVVERGLAAGGARAVTIPDGEYELISPEAGDSLVLTLDRTVQFEVESLLEQTVAEAGAKSGTAIVSRTATGEILAMSTVARSDAGIISVSGENKAVTWIVEPGSISKPLAIGALLEEGLITPQTTVEVTGELEVYDQVFEDSTRYQPEVLTTGQVLASSSNVGVALLVDRLSDERFHDYLTDYGLGTPTALNFPGESAGILYPEEEWSGVSKPFAAIGYGYAATPLQMLRAYNVFANDGVLVEPHVVAGVRSPDGDFDIVSPREGRRVVSVETAHQVSSLLAGVVSEGGTGVLASVPGYEIAGKTGTARISQPGGGYQDENGEVHLLASFAGYLPAANPELSIIVMIEEPEGDASGGRVAAPLFSEISNFALQHFRIPPADSVATR